MTNDILRQDNSNPTYRSYRAMVARCTSVRQRTYAHYGARGISVASVWLGSGGFTRFVHDVGARPEGMTLDRFPNRTGNYEPGNVRWATKREQQRNTTCSVMLTFDGREMCAIDWAAELGLHPQTVYSRIARKLPVADVLRIGKLPRVVTTKCPSTGKFVR